VASLVETESTYVPQPWKQAQPASHVAPRAL